MTALSVTSFFADDDDGPLVATTREGLESLLDNLDDLATLDL